jgi:integrase
MQVHTDSAPQNCARDGLEKNSKHLAKTDLAYWRRRIFKQPNSPNWFAAISARGVRRKLSLGSPNKENAALVARDIYELARVVGWDAVAAKYRSRQIQTRSNLTVGQFISLAQSVAGVKRSTLYGYIKSLRKIVSNCFSLDTGKAKYDPHSGNRLWLGRVHAVKLERLTPQRVQAWKRSFLARAKADPLSQRSAKVTVNTSLRQARSLFSKKILKHLQGINLPDPLPFSQVEFEPRQSLKYRTAFDVQTLIAKARDQLAQSDPEAFKVFLLAVMVGLRRKEIDLLEWNSFLWDIGVVRIQSTEYFDAKTEDSLADVAVDGELLELFRGYQARATSAFVIESLDQLRPGANYLFYRCQKVFDRLICWLRENGLVSKKPLHTLRKEFGCRVNELYGIHAASRALRHSSVTVTDQYYTDGRRRAAPGFGALLRRASP